MSFYLSNADTGPTGFEPLEFLDVPDLPADLVSPFLPVDPALPPLAARAAAEAAPDDARLSIDARAPRRERRGWARRLRALTTRSADRRRSSSPETGQR